MYALPGQVHELIASYVQIPEVVVKFSDAAWAFDSRRSMLITAHRAIRTAWQQMTSRLRLAGVRNLSGPDRNPDFVRGLPVASLQWFLDEFMHICHLVIPCLPHEHALAKTLRQHRARCFPTPNPHVNASRLRLLRDLWRLSILTASLIRRELRILTCVVRGICMTVREAAIWHTSRLPTAHNNPWWGVCFPCPSLFAASWKETTCLVPFPASDMPMRTNLAIVTDYLEYARNVYELRKWLRPFTGTGLTMLTGLHTDSCFLCMTTGTLCLNLIMR